MRKFSTDAAGFAALTVSELILQQCVVKGLFTAPEARNLLNTAVRRHQNSAIGSDEKIALNDEAADLLATLSQGLEPLFRKFPVECPDAATEPLRKSKETWVRFPD
ncbi:MAG: hypothetical protein COB93_09950 [Sneathiella sp.]|nr:MAG: hypothetical protein COB93_09950 [Sneathiella sp.]